MGVIFLHAFSSHITQTLMRTISAHLASLAHLLFQQGTKSKGRAMCEWAPCSRHTSCVCPDKVLRPYAAKHNQDRWWWGHGGDLKTARRLSNPERLLPARADKCALRHENTLWSGSGEYDTDFSAGVNHRAVEHVKTMSTLDKAMTALVDFGRILSGNKQSFSWLVLYL